MERKGLIRRFGSYTVQQLDQMKKDLCIGMSMPTLTFCASYYRNEKRDPSIAEFQFLDRFSACAEQAFSAIAPTELYTNDAFVADTYADMMKKRHELNPDRKAPCTLTEMAHLASAYLERAGKRASSPDLLCSLQKRNTPYAVRTNDTVSLPDSDIGLCVFQKQLQPLSAGDLILLLRPLSKHTVTDYDTPIEKLLNTPTLTAQIKQLRTVGACGLFAEVMKLTPSASIEPDRLSETGELIPLSMLTDAYAGDLLVILPRERYPEFAKEAYTLGVRAAAFATVTNGTRIAVVRRDGNGFSLQSRFLRALFPLRPVSVRLGNERDGDLAPITHTPRIPTSCAYLYRNTPKHESETVTIASAVCSAASVSPKQAFFRNALDTALSSVLTLAASGCDYPEQRLAVSVKLPQNTADPSVAGAAVSTILGVYRLQAELALPATSIRFDCDPTLEIPTLQVFALSHGTSCPTGFTAAGNHVYCLAPATTDDGIPDFDDLRRLLSRLAALRKSGVLQSARVLCREAVIDAIRSMSDERFGCHTNGREVIAQDVLPLGILIETTEEISATKLGVVTARGVTALPTVEKILPTRERLVLTDTPEVVLISQDGDRDAHILAAILSANGATVSHLSVASLDATQLSRKLLTASTLILCANADLPDTPHVRFALDTMRRAGGTVLLLGGAQIAFSPCGITLSDGIYPKMITQICQK